MYKVKFTTAYKKSYKLMKKRGLDLFAYRLRSQRSQIILDIQIPDISV